VKTYNPSFFSRDTAQFCIMPALCGKLSGAAGTVIICHNVPNQLGLDLGDNHISDIDHCFGRTQSSLG